MNSKASESKNELENLQQHQQEEPLEEEQIEKEQDIKHNNSGVQSSSRTSSFSISNLTNSSDSFATRVNHIPVVSSITNFYETTKSSSTILKFGAQTVETSVKAVYKPFQGIVEPQLNSFGCRQLDKIQNQYPIIMETPGSMYENSKKFLKGALEKQIDNALYVAESAVDRFLPEDAEMKEGSPAPENHDMDTSVMRAQRIGSLQNRLQKKAVSRWNSVYVKSHETIVRMEKTVEVVQSAKNHIHNQSQQLGSALQEMQQFIERKTSELSSSFEKEANRTLHLIAGAAQSIQKDIIETIRKTVGVISKGAVAMPSYAQARIKEWILSLPQKWAEIAGSSPTSPEDSQKFITHGNAVVKFSQDSVAMLKSIIDLFSQYIDRAKAILETVNLTIQSKPNTDPTVNDENTVPNSSEMKTD